MDFKSRFQGKMTRITREGAIDDMIQQTNQPIYKVDKITLNHPSATQLISYGSTINSKQDMERTGGFQEVYDGDNIYMKGGANMAEVLQASKQMSVAMRMKRNREGNNGANKDTEEGELY
jgi:hydroxymethylpyrimidine/phosphomethylpyrimidine kinase